MSVNELRYRPYFSHEAPTFMTPVPSRVPIIPQNISMTYLLLNTSHCAPHILLRFKHKPSNIRHSMPHIGPSLDTSRESRVTHLEFCMALEQQHIHHTDILHIPMSLKFLSHLRPQHRHRQVECVLGLDFGGLSSSALVSLPVFPWPCSLPCPSTAMCINLYTYRSNPLPIALQDSCLRIFQADG